MNITDRFHVIPVLSDGDLNAGATLDGDSINMKNNLGAAFIVGFQTLGGADSVVKVYSGATAAAATTALPFRYRLGGAAAGSANADVFAAWTTAVAADGYTIPNATADNKTLLIEVDAAEMGPTHNWLTIQFSDPNTGATGNVQVHALLEPRYSETPFVTSI